MHSVLGHRLTLALGLIFVSLGAVEVIWKFSDENYWGVAFFGGSLLGGGALILGGLFARIPVKYARAMIIAGVIVGLPASIWTILIPILAIAVIVFTVRGAPPANDLA